MATTTRPSLFYIPTEIIEAIIEELDDYSTLYACSLVCREFFPLAQRRLYSSIALVSNSKSHRKGRYDQFMRTLTSNPNLAQYICSLHIEDDVYFDRYKVKCRSILAEPLLRNILGMLYHVKTFALKCTPGSGEWTDFSKPLMHALCSFLVRPSICVLRLEGVLHLPNAFAKCFARIPSLIFSRSIGFIGQNELEHMKVALDLPPISKDRSLRKLTIEGSVMYPISLQPLLEEIKQCKLEALVMNFYVSKAGNDVAIDLMERHKTTLAICKLPKYVFSADELSKIDIGTYPCLRVIQIYASFDERDPLQNATSILSKGRDENTIQEIIIRYKPRYHDRVEYLTHESARLDSLLTGPKYSGLQTIKFIMLRTFLGKILEDESTSYIKRHLPELSGRDLLRFSNETSAY